MTSNHQSSQATPIASPQNAHPETTVDGPTALGFLTLVILGPFAVPIVCLYLAVREALPL